MPCSFLYERKILGNCGHQQQLRDRIITNSNYLAYKKLTQKDKKKESVCSMNDDNSHNELAVAKTQDMKYKERNSTPGIHMYIRWGCVRNTCSYACS